MPPYRLAYLNPEMHTAIASLEDEIGVVLVAYEPLSESDTEMTTDDGDAMDAIRDSYRTFDPQIQ